MSEDEGTRRWPRSSKELQEALADLSRFHDQPRMIVRNLLRPENRGARARRTPAAAAAGREVRARLPEPRERAPRAPRLPAPAALRRERAGDRLAREPARLELALDPGPPVARARGCARPSAPPRGRRASPRASSASTRAPRGRSARSRARSRRARELAPRPRAPDAAGAGRARAAAPSAAPGRGGAVPCAGARRLRRAAREAGSRSRRATPPAMRVEVRRRSSAASISSRATSAVDWMPWILSLNSFGLVARFSASSSVIRPDL